ncbi:MAG TPA: DUF4331 domain-containing protein [Bryobacteraceae bacterium]|nr:DUF4331 domain-containing protein [Bryobacteraceae bacterium]
MFQRLLWKPALAVAISALVGQPALVLGASHREAPITALDQKADITDWFAFVSPEHPDKVIMILNVDPFLEPSNGPNYFPFDPGILYEMKVDNNHDGVEDVTFQFRFHTEIRAPGVFTGFVGNLAGIPAITALDGPGSEGLNLRQTYTVTMVTKSGVTDLTGGQTLFAVPTNVGPRTMPDYDQLRQQGVYQLPHDIRVFAGTVADPFFIDLGAAFDSLNFRMAAGGGVLSAAVDADDHNNYAPNTLAGFNVNTMVLEVPIDMLTRDGRVHAPGDKDAVIGTYGTTSRRRLSVLRNQAAAGDNGFAQVQRLGNPLINELIIGTGSKDRFSMDDPKNDSQFASFFLNPLLAQLFGTLGIPVAPPPRTDLLILAQYQAPICPGCGPSDAGPVADLLRLNTGIPPTPEASQKRMGFLAGDTAGWPNGRRPVDDVVDIAARAVAGILVDATKFGTRIGDGVNAAASPASSTFPFLSPAYSGRDSAHAGPGQPGCTNQPGGICPTM